MKTAVPNCPGWTVYNAAVHVGRVGVAWHSMINATPDDPESRTRGYADADARGTGHAPEVLQSWALAAIDAIGSDVDRQCYFSMTGGMGTAGLWGWHAASELAVHRLDIEDALGMDHALSDDLAVDAIEYTAKYFLPAMARVIEQHPKSFMAVADRDGEKIGRSLVRVDDGELPTPVATMNGRPVDVLLALWGRRHGPVEHAGEPGVIEAWKALPGTAFQFGTWD